MKNLFNDISQDERNRILEMHKSATRKNYLSEQTPAPAPAPTPEAPPAIPKDVKSKVPGKFNWNNMLSLWMTASQGYTTGDDYMWFAIKRGTGGGGETSELYLHTLTPGGFLGPKYKIVLKTNWEFWGDPGISDFGDRIFPQGSILDRLFITNINWDSYPGGQTIDLESYSAFLTNYIRTHMDSKIAKALTVPPRATKENNLTAQSVSTIINSPLYKQLASLVTPAAPATPTTPARTTPATPARTTPQNR
jgi:hypothetical protein